MWNGKGGERVFSRRGRCGATDIMLTMTEPANNPTSPAGPGTMSSAAPGVTTPPASTTPPPAEPPKRRGKVGRVIKWTFVVLLLAIVAGGALVWINLNGIVKRTIESQSTAQLKLKTELDSAALSLFGGELNLDDLRIASPQGFTAPHMFTLDGVDVNVKLNELRDDPVRVQSITLDKPKLVVERAGNRFNFKAAMDQMPKRPEPPPEDPNAEPLRLIIGELTVRDPAVVIRPGDINIPGIELAKEFTITIPTMSMKNIGTGEDAQNGAAVKDVVMQVITAMAAAAANSDQIPDQLKNLLNVDVNQVVAGLTAEAQKRIVAAVPGEAGKVLSNIIADPNALVKDPGKVVGAEAAKVQEQVTEEARRRAEGLIGNITGGPTTQPATQPADRVKQEAGKAIEKGIGDLFNRDRRNSSEKK